MRPEIVVVDDDTVVLKRTRNILDEAGMKPIAPFPPLGAKERLFRWLYGNVPLPVCDWLYIYSRRLFGAYLYFTHLPRRRVNIGMGENWTEGEPR